MANIAEVTTATFASLSPLDSEERYRSLLAVIALLGEDFVLHKGSERPGRMPRHEEVPEAATETADDNGFGEKARKWMLQNHVDRQAIDQIYHVDGESVELIAPAVAGKTRKEKTVNCYLLVGIRALLEGDEPTFSDKEAIAFCHQTDAYDRNNHTTNRKSLRNRVSGDRTSGFTLTVPGLRDAAKLIAAMSGGNQ